MSLKSARVHLTLVAVALLPLLSEAFMHTPGMYGGHNNSNNESTTSSTKATSTQAQKLANPWLWVAIVAFGICMFFCLRTSLNGDWKRLCGQESNDGGDIESGYSNRSPFFGGGGNNGGGGGGTYQRGNMAGFR